MSAIADGIDFLVDLFTRSSTVHGGSGVDHGGLKSASGMAYMAFSFMWLFVYHKVSQKDFSAIVTCGAVLQCLGFLTLTLKVRATRSVSGISSKMLQMFMFYLTMRLCSTTLKKGYIPVDRSGHFFYQFMDTCSLVLAAQLVYLCHKTYRHTYQEEFDTLPLAPLVAAGVIMACFIHADFNRNLFFDIVWFVSLNCETVSLLPQLWMMSRIGGKVRPVSAQFIFCTVVSKVLIFTFWVWAYPELVTRAGSNLAGKHIASSYFVQLVFCGDFAFYYAKAMFLGTDHVELPSSAENLEM